MSTTSPRTSDQALVDPWRSGELPPLTTSDRVALRLGLALILWGQRHADRAERAEHARVNHAAERAEQARASAFEHRSHAGPTW
jgi:hypothetical protein